MNHKALRGMTLKGKFHFGGSRLSLFLTVTALTCCFPGEAGADLNDEIRREFNGMRTVTRPDAYKTQRRGILSGGTLGIRNGIADSAVLSVSAPGVKAGCRGIDLYGGSFSYINREEFIRFLRAVAANAEGYAFEVALSSMCEKCAQHIETLQRKVQSLNQYFGNSCQLAQGIVNDSLSAFDGKGLNDVSLLGQAEGIGDLFEVNTSTDTASLYGKINEVSGSAVKRAELTGNILWNMFGQSPVLKGDPRLAEAVMSLTGTVIVSRDGTDVRLVPGLKISIHDLVSGGETYMYSCTDYDDGCTALKTSHAEIKGFGSIIRGYFLGNGTGRGIIYRYARNLGSFTPEETEFLNTLPEGIGSMIRNLSARNEHAAEMFVDKTADIMALLYTKNLADRYLNEASALVRMSGNAYSGLLDRQIREVREGIDSEIAYLSGIFGGFNDLGRIYLEYLELLPEKDYVPERFVSEFG